LTQTIIINTGNKLFDGADPIGLMYDVSASRYVDELRGRIREEFPNAQVFVRWSPSSADAAEVKTVPKASEMETRVREMTVDVRENREAWIRYDQSVLNSFAR
jgi:hypothetical protein